jgi:hypothetical protein
MCIATFCSREPRMPLSSAALHKLAKLLLLLLPQSMHSKQCGSLV